MVEALHRLMEIEGHICQDNPSALVEEYRRSRRKKNR